MTELGKVFGRTVPFVLDMFMIPKREVEMSSRF